MPRLASIAKIIAAIVLLVIIDQAIKAWVVANMAYGEEWPLLPFLSFLHARNTGVAFSMFSNGSVLFLVGLPILIMGLIGYMLYRTEPHERYSRIGFIMILGGAVGNVIDRALLGYVVDYVYFHTPVWSFAIFNFADAIITLGVGFVLLQEFIHWRHSKDPSDNSSSSD